ncbi:MAG: prepilin-type N-terminal cleavage/methylation domain-containing protein [Tenericutes bacterium]|nr:prepilin-type N-terminal cleavage/methylation domain-containing protein [Mycoplasmatota bacterium]
MKKGFTLIELLAVIVILSVITLITVPMITNVIEESKKKALASSIQGLVESANLYAIENDGVYEFLFDKEHKGSTKKGESLDYRGAIDGDGKLYLDKEGNVSVCISNDNYYVYKNYNSGIIVGDKKTGNCIIGFDALTNKYVAMLDNGTVNVSNVYSKDEVNNLVDSLDTKITNNTNEITNMKRNIEELQSNLNNYALQSELEQTNINVENLSSLVSSNTESINNLNNRLEKNIGYPDLTKNQKIIIGNGTYTIKENGYIRVYFSRTSGNVKVNGVAYIYSGLDIEMTFPPMLVKAGDIITAVGFKDNNSSVSFVPFC